MAPQKHALSIQTLSISLLLLVAFLVRWVVASSSNGYMGIEADLIEYKQAMHRALTQGMHDVYTANVHNDPALTGKEWEGGYFITNPPARIYAYYPFVLAYRHFSPEGFALWSSELNFFHDIRDRGLKWRIAESRGFSLSLKLPAILADVVISGMIFLFLKSHVQWRLALLAAALYAFTPGVVLDSAHTGSHDAVAMMLLVFALWSASRGWIEAAAVLFVVSALNKPQAAAFLFFMLFLGLRFFPVRRVIRAALLAVMAAGLVFLPFFLHGTFTTTLTALFYDTFGGEPYISLNATNVWWLLSLGQGAEIPDTASVFGIVTYRTLGLTMFLLANLYTMHRLSLAPLAAPRVFLGAAFIGMAYFTLNTELHENHMIYVLPLVLLALPCDKFFFGVAAVLAVTLSLNFILLDPIFYSFLNGVASLDQKGIIVCSVVSAGVNLLVFMAMGCFLYRETKVPDQATSAWIRSAYWTPLEILMTVMAVVALLASAIALNPVHVSREYRLEVNNPRITNKQDAIAMMNFHRYENIIAGFAKEQNTTPEAVMSGIDTVVDIEAAPTGGLVAVLRFSSLEKDRDRLDRLAPVLIQLQGALQEDLNGQEAP